MPSYWLLKTEPQEYSLSDLERDQTTVWNGVRNHTALKNMRTMHPGDLALIYHTGTERQIVGIAEIASAPYPDPQHATANAKLVVVDVRFVRRLPRPIPLTTIKTDPFFADFALVRQARLSVVPIEDRHWERILQITL